MDLDAGAVERESLQLDAHGLLALQVLEDSVEHAAVRPAAHPGVDGVPVAEICRQPMPLATMLGDIQGVEHLEIGQADVLALHW